ncbi:hypothetical protein BH24ACT8_BH24ACT8_06400 [soil metagenome]|jgi:hypothetical protein
MAVDGDLAIDCIEGRRGLQTRLLNRYMARYCQAAYDPVLAVRFARVSSLLDPPGALRHPTTPARVIRGNLAQP